MSGHAQPGKAPGSRLKPVADSLDTVGFVSKGDRKLLDHKVQKEYYDKIVNRYMEFCARHSKNLEAAWTSLPRSASSDATSNPPASLPSLDNKSTGPRSPSPSTELSTILLSLRKLREAVLATSSTIPISFSQQVHIFSIKFAIQARHPPSYFPSFRYILEELHTSSHPLPDSDLKDLISYWILDYACRQEDMVAAYQLRARARRRYGFQSSTIDRVLNALAHDNWIVFWQIRQDVDSRMRAVMNWAEDRVRRHALKAVGKAYLSTDTRWVTEGCTGDSNWTWENLVKAESLGWEKEGDRIIIRKPKQRPQNNLAPIKENP
ncbi:hypothetical protein AtubIFM55763_003409 [Aspergillus tubingensis]|uniref:Uncharacterized protein n=2 Tax=Aspergillus subgen. Circumdati TaxID=2720871 RepID=A0A8H3T3U0_ASPTU|nr:similar to An16g04550 [Aspergillus tubingensis]GAQ43270.1 similar to An16g04550 [Aspergillus niger]GFN19900.1 similar to An16g04550 [Aspergillus tubingensis]GLA63690.1 hypothetical protein AtubIFM54640_004845 [Aspergillus tubingensis]GLA68339.1 hypothetical protein AtubIFM55763_003409 [Aspergillus tubingensis]GLA87276.1 hypothetical protein AtubIFM56815_001699 [Aspergillus tubingensis]